MINVQKDLIANVHEALAKTSRKCSAVLTLVAYEDKLNPRVHESGKEIVTFIASEKQSPLS